MEGLGLATIMDLVGSGWQLLLEPIHRTPWRDWRGFWLGDVLDDRFVVVYFLPLLPVLLLAPFRRLRLAIVLTGLSFLAYVVGLLYAGLWLLTCVVFYRVGERFAVECRRTDVWPMGPPLAAIAIIGGWYAATMALHELRLPPAWNDWLFRHAPWIFPLGARGLRWEPCFYRLHDSFAPGRPFPLLHAMFANVHNIGTAYLAARMLHYFSELKRHALPQPRRSLLNFLAYTCYAPTLIQGPIERFGPFQDEMDTCHQRRRWRNLPAGLARIGLGLGKSLIVTWYFHPLLGRKLGLGGPDTFWKHPEQIQSFTLLYLGGFLIIFTLYLEFSGYCDVAAGMARLLGYRQVENFARPWLATSLREFWRRWHISLTSILRDYVYIPLGGNRRRALFNVCFTFLVCGLWHRLVLQVAIWGLLMGLMVGINQAWARWMKRLDQAPSGMLPTLRRWSLRCQPLPRILAWLITQHAFVFSLLVFFGGGGAVNVVREIVRRAWILATSLGG